MRGGKPIRHLTACSPNTAREIAKRNADFKARISGFLYVRENRHAHRESFVRALRSEEIYAIAHSVVPRGLPSFMADDIKSDLVLGLLTGEIHSEGAHAAVRGLMAAYGRTYLHHDRSLDSTIGDGARTFGSLLADASAFDASGTGLRLTEVGASGNGYGMRAILSIVLTAFTSAASAACNPEDVSLKQAKVIIRPTGSARLVGEVVSTCSQPTRVLLIFVSRGKDGGVVSVDKPWLEPRPIPARGSIPFDILVSPAAPVDKVGSTIQVEP